MKIGPSHTVYSAPTHGAVRKPEQPDQRMSNDTGRSAAAAPPPVGQPQYGQTLYELVHLLNMSRPEGLDAMTPGNRIVAPGMALALRSDGPQIAPGNGVKAPVGPRLVTADQRAQGIIDQIGAGGEVKLDQAMALLLWDSDTHETNNADTLRTYFEWLDRDGSGSLGFE